MPGGLSVAVIGAGPSGLAAAKELLAEGHAVSGFEAAASLGGVFRFDEEAGVVWESCRLTSSAALTAFSDFPAARPAVQMTIGEYVAYLADYARAFSLLPHFQFGARVTAVSRQESGAWRVEWTASDGGRRAGAFDAVAVASGLHQHPFLPRFAGLESFTGTVSHASKYRRAESLRGKEVLVVGAGETGADLAAEAAAVARRTVLSLRRGVFVFPRRLYGHPNDFQTCRLAGGAAPWIAATRHPDDEDKRRLYRRLLWPVALLDDLLQRLVAVGWEVLPSLGQGRWLRGRSGWAEIGLARDFRRQTRRLLAESGGAFGEQFATKSDDFVRALVEGRCERAPAIEKFAGRRVVFTDGSWCEPDVVLLATGFETRIPFLDSALADRGRYLHTFDPEMGDRLAFLGFARPALGAIPPIAELQARWFALLLSGRVRLPERRAMEQDIADRLGERRRRFRAIPDRPRELVDYISFCDELARQIGCLPSARLLAAESARFRRRFFAGPFVAAQYRLCGPHADPERARRAIEELPIALPWPRWLAHQLRRRSTLWLERKLGAGYGA